MDSASASASDSDPEWEEEEEEEEEEEDAGKVPSRPTRFPASPSSTVAAVRARSATSKQTSLKVTKNKDLKVNDSNRMRGVRRRIKKRNQLFRHKLVLPDNYLALSYPPPTAAASLAEADGSTKGVDENAVLQDSDSMRQRSGMTEKKLGSKKQQQQRGGDNSSGKSLDPKTTSVDDDDQRHHDHPNSTSLWDCISDRDGGDCGDDEYACDELVSITTNAVDIDLIGESGDDDDDDSNHQYYNQQKRQRRERLEIQSRHMPQSGNVFYWSCSKPSSGSSRASKEGEKGPPGTSTDTPATLIRLHSLQRRVEREDVLIQSMAPSCIEFRAMQWGERTNTETSLTHGLSAATLPAAKTGLQLGTTEQTKLMSQGAEKSDDAIIRVNDCTNPLVDYTTQQTFFTLAPCKKSYATTKVAHDFLSALQNAAGEASATTTTARTSEKNISTLAAGSQIRFGNVENGRHLDPKTDTSTSSPYPLGVIMECLSIIAESRSKPQNAPFHLMKRIWTLILSVASRCKNGTQLAQNLASKFDAFLPEGYSMMSSNLLFLQSQALHDRQLNEIETRANGNDNISSGERCARTKQFEGLIENGVL